MPHADAAPHPANAPGRWFIDRRCIDCDAAVQVAPGLIDRRDGQAVVVRQPQDDEEERAMWLAALACPTTSVRTDPPSPRPTDLYPLELADGVHYLGFNSPDSYGANAFLAVRPQGTAMIDAPRWSKVLVDRLEQLGGVDHILLTHRDDVADADRYAAHFGADVWIHQADASAAPYATRIIEGLDPVVVFDRLSIHVIPGHTRGHVAFSLDDRFLFSGDSLFWHRRRGDLAIHEHFTWYSLEAQIDSLERLNAEVRFSYVLAGHGDRHETTVEDMHTRLAALVGRYR